MLFYMSSLLGITYVAMFEGFMIGCIIHEETRAYLFFWLSLMIFNFGAGFFANTGSQASWFVNGISFISPMHYATEVSLRIVTDGR